jgi:hypothetical protein
MKLMHQKSQLNGIHGYILHHNKIEKKHDLEKYDWQKPHQPNLTGTEKLIIQIKIKMLLKKNIKLGKIKLFNYILFFLSFFLLPILQMI